MKKEPKSDIGSGGGQMERERTSIIYESCEAANDALGPCPRALAGSDGGHWWYIDHEADPDDPFPAIQCVCKTCPQKMWLSPDADEYPI